MRKMISAILFFLIFQTSFCQKSIPVIIESPDRKVKAVVRMDNKKISLTVHKNRELAFRTSLLGMTVDSSNIGEGVTLAGATVEKMIDEKYALFGNHTEAFNKCREASIPLKSNKIFYNLVVRSYDDGVAIRYIIQADRKMRMEGDNTAFSVPALTECYWAYYSNDNENLHNQSLFSEIPEGSLLLAPLTVKSSNFYLSFSEADCKNFPDLSWIKTGENLKANFTTNPKSWEIEQGTFTSPWRLAIIADNLTQLVNSDLIMNLCESPNPFYDFNWVKPGRVLWQWWSVGAPKYKDQKKWYDAAARLTWEYYLIDDGWRLWGQAGKDQWQCLKEVIDYGKSKGVQSIVWVDSKEMRTREGIRTYLEKVKLAGAVGIKIDFIPPATPDIMQWYQAALEETYKLQLLCNFHGCVKPTGLRRTWPHELTREGVRGNEYNMTRYNRVMPKNQDELVPFTRLIAGPADFTPVIFSEKELIGFSWVHELSQAIVYLSPLTHFADSYKQYINNPAEDILQKIPTVWDETIVLPCTEVGRVAAFARRKGADWWIGIVNGEKDSDLSFKLDFLSRRQAKATTLSDKREVPDAFIREEKLVRKTDQINLHIRPGGGYFMLIRQL